MERIKVKYEALPPVIDIEGSMEEDAPILHENVGSNVANHRTFHYGKVDQAFEEADRIIKHKYLFRNIPQPLWRHTELSQTMNPVKISIRFTPIFTDRLLSRPSWLRH